MSQAAGRWTRSRGTRTVEDGALPRPGLASLFWAMLPREDTDLVCTLAVPCGPRTTPFS